MFLDTKAVGDAERLYFGEDRGAGVAFFLGVVPVLLIAGEIHLDLPGLEFSLLQAKHICVYLIKNLHKVLFHNGS